jgi:hypothetical protein
VIRQRRGRQSGRPLLSASSFGIGRRQYDHRRIISAPATILGSSLSATPPPVTIGTSITLSEVTLLFRIKKS